MAEQLSENLTPKSPEIVEAQQTLFLSRTSAEKLGVDESELERINALDSSGKNVEEIKSDLLGILQSPERVEQIWSQYVDFLRHKESILVDDLLEHRDQSGVLVDFLDWDYIKKTLHNGSAIIAPRAGEVVLDKETAGSNFFIILKGSVKYEKRTSEGETIREVENHPYEYFGDQAILNDKITDSTNTVVSPDGAILMQIEAETFKTALERKKNELVKSVKAELAIPEEVLSEIIAQGRINSFREMQCITVQEGDNNHVRILLKGTAFALRDSRSTFQLKPGSFIGDIELFEPGHKYISSVITNEDCVVLEIDTDDLRKIISRHRPFQLQLSQLANQKEIQGRRLVEDVDHYGLFNYDFSRLAKGPETESVRNEILQATREIISLIVKENPEADSQALDDLFKYICYSLETQEIDDPKHYVTHGAMHTIHVLNFAQSALEGSSTFKGNINNLFGEGNGQIILRLAALFHDIGYSDLKDEEYKWKHQEYSANQVKKAFPFEILTRVLKINEDQYELFLQAIGHHGSDNPSPESQAKGRPFLATDNETNPILTIMRLADNLDLVSERLNKLQKDRDFLEIFERLHKAALEINSRDDLGPEQKKIERRTTMTEILEQEIQKLRGKAPEGDLDEESRLREINDNLNKIIGIDNWEGYAHFASIAIAQNTFIREMSEENKLRVYIVYNQPTSNLPLELIKWQSGRLNDSVKNSLTLKGADGDQLQFEIKQIFPNPRT